MSTNPFANSSPADNFPYRFSGILGVINQRALHSTCQPSFHIKINDDHWEPISWLQISAKAEALARGLLLFGVRPGSRIALCLPSGATWEICHLGALSAGCMVMGIDEAETDEAIINQCNLVRPDTIVCQNAEFPMRLNALGIHCKLVISESGQGAGPTLDEIINCQSQFILPSIDPSHGAEIFFSSGTTGTQKGLYYTHHQVVLACKSILSAISLSDNDRGTISWLPLTSVFQRIINICSLMTGRAIYFNSDVKTILNDLRMIRPGIFIGVPRFYEKLAFVIDTNVTSLPPVLRWPLMALRWGSQHAYDRMCTKESIMDIWFTACLRSIHGYFCWHTLRCIMSLFFSGLPRIKFFSGSAPLPENVIRKLFGYGIVVRQGYAMTECAVPISIHSGGIHSLASVGTVLPGNDICILDSGELCVRGQGIAGVLSDIPASLPVDNLGFFHTGDLVTRDSNCYLWHHGRVDDIFKTSTGKKIDPIYIERILKTAKNTCEVVVVGRELPYPVAIVFPENNEGIQQIACEILLMINEFPIKYRPIVAIIFDFKPTVCNSFLTSNGKIKRRYIERISLSAIRKTLPAFNHNGKALVFIKNGCDITAFTPSHNLEPLP